jgi:hypothetical protein
MIRVKDGSRILQFEGQLLSHSTSWRDGSDRWVEFSLYRTEAGSYVLSRIGQSLLYHLPQCKVVQRNSLHESPRSELSRGARPCELCRPDQQPTFPIICAERPRYHAQVCEGPAAVLDSLYRYDPAGSRYLTLVAARLLDDASELDEDISINYRVQTIQ